MFALSTFKTLRPSEWPGWLLCVAIVSLFRVLPILVGAAIGLWVDALCPSLFGLAPISHTWLCVGIGAVFGGGFTVFMEIEQRKARAEISQMSKAIDDSVRELSDAEVAEALEVLAGEDRIVQAVSTEADAAPLDGRLHESVRRFFARYDRLAVRSLGSKPGLTDMHVFDRKRVTETIDGIWIVGESRLGFLLVVDTKTGLIAYSSGTPRPGDINRIFDRSVCFPLDIWRFSLTWARVARAGELKKQTGKRVRDYGVAGKL